MSNREGIVIKEEPAILVIDDEINMCELLHDSLIKEGYNVYITEMPHKAIEIVKRNDVKIALLDLVMPGMDGMDVLKEIINVRPDVKVIIMTAYGTIDTAVEAMKLGAFDYITKPFKMIKIKTIIARILEEDRIIQENVQLRRELERKHRFENIVGNSTKMQEVYEMIEKVAQSDCNILIQGESGTGKELIARAIHYTSPRREKPFIVQSCAVLPENLLESELFGHVKGAFTGATSTKHGLFETADEGTFFLDEIGTVKQSIQAKLLRVLEEHEFKKLGTTNTIKVDVRLIAATNRDLEQAVKEGTFRNDLFYRLNVVLISVPPLRARKEDIPLLANHFLGKYSASSRKNIISISPRVMEIFMAYDWPGNVRELENIIERAVVLTMNDNILPQDLPQQLHIISLKEQRSNSRSLADTVKTAEREKIVDVLKQAGWRKNMAAEILGISRKALWEKMKFHNIENAVKTNEKKRILEALRRTGWHRIRTAEIMGISRKTLWEKMKFYSIKKDNPS